MSEGASVTAFTCMLDFVPKSQTRFAKADKIWSGRRESNPRGQFGRLELYH